MGAADSFYSIQNESGIYILYVLYFMSHKQKTRIAKGVHNFLFHRRVGGLLTSVGHFQIEFYCAYTLI